MNGTDGDLIQRYAATRNAECFAELVARYRDMVYSAVVRVVREPASAEDVTQECFLRLARSAASIRGSVAAWLHTVAVNASVDALRQERSRRRREEQAADMTTHDEDEASWDEIKHEVHQAIERLPEKLRGPLVLHFLAGRRQSEVASELGVAQSTVSRRIEQGVARLREHLKQAGVVV
ncbi:MAG: RNA polymerase sigma factor, partial [Armatimonadota bacterium]